MLLYTANISDYIKPAIPVMTKIVEVSDMINNACRDLLDFNVDQSTMWIFLFQAKSFTHYIRFKRRYGPRGVTVELWTGNSSFTC